MNILDTIIATKHKEVAALRNIQSYNNIYDQALATTRPAISFSESILNSPSGIIAEFKRRSPSKGYIKQNADIGTIIPSYTLNGAAAISVLTDSEYFAGSLGDLVKAREITSLPLLRKDFIIDAYQLCEARIAGADVILLIAAALTKKQTYDLAKTARNLGMEVLLEVHNEQELDHVNEYINVVGVNNRDLTTFVTDIGISEKLLEKIPDSTVRISESGISDPHTVTELRKAGYNGFLMGENFMKERDPGEALDNFIKQL